MKYIKLLLVFLILGGGIVLALNWGSLFGGTPEEEGFASEDGIDINAECDRIRKDWDTKKAWDESVYQSHRDRIDRYKGMEVLSRTGFNTLNNALREESVNATCLGYRTALKAGSQFNHQQLVTEFKGVERVKELEGLQEDSRIKEIENIHGYYTKVRNFVGSSHTITARFDTTKTQWQSFDYLQRNILSSAKQLRESSLYKEMSTVPGFDEGLNETKLRSDTESQRKRFYQSLCDQIISYFSAITPTEDRVRLLNSIYKLFVQEDTGYVAVEKLARFTGEYQVKEYNNE